MYKDKLEEGIHIKVIGDSFAAGAGSSMSYETEDLIFENNGIKFFSRVAPNSWWGLLGKYLQDTYTECTIKNKGCGGAFSYQINKYLDSLIAYEDNLVLVFMGLNDRKLKNGMEELETNLECIIDKLTSQGKMVAILTPTPSVYSNEYYPNRIYHTENVVSVLRDVANRKNKPLIDNYQYVIEFLQRKHLKIEDIIYGDGCRNDGLHPSDDVQKLMFQNLIQTLQI